MRALRRDGLQRRGHRQRLELQLRGHAAAARKLASISEQAVGDIDAGAGVSAQALAERHARGRQQEALAQVSRGCLRRPARRDCSTASPAAASPGVPDTNRASPARAPLRRRAPPAATMPSSCTVTHSGPGVVSPPTNATWCSRARPPKPAANSASQASSCLRQRQRQQCPGRARAHGGDVAQVHGERAMADRAGRGAVREMHPGDQGIGGRDQLAAGRHVQRARASSPMPSAHIRTLRAAVAEVALDEGGFGERHGRAAPPSARRDATRAPRDPTPH